MFTELVYYRIRKHRFNYVGQFETETSYSDWFIILLMFMKLRILQMNDYIPIKWVYLHEKERKRKKNEKQIQFRIKQTK